MSDSTVDIEPLVSKIHMLINIESPQRRLEVGEELRQLIHDALGRAVTHERHQTVVRLWDVLDANTKTSYRLSELLEELYGSTTRGRHVAEDETNEQIRVVKAYRKALDSVRVDLNTETTRSRERSLAVTKVDEAIMWLGMELRRLHDGKTCYPASYDATSTVVEPVPDGVFGGPRAG